MLKSLQIGYAYYSCVNHIQNNCSSTPLQLLQQGHSFLPFHSDTYESAYAYLCTRVACLYNSGLGWLQ